MDGPICNGSSRKYLMAASTRAETDRLDYFESSTAPLRSLQLPSRRRCRPGRHCQTGKSTYVGLSNYPADKFPRGDGLPQEQHVPCLIYQGKYSMFNRQPEQEYFPVTMSSVGFYPFSRCTIGVDRQVSEWHTEQSVLRSCGFLRKEQVTDDL